MADPSGLGGLASMGMEAFTNMFNAGMTQQTNQENRQFSEHMYDKQHADALSFWNMQNEYNAPEQQMNRFKSAGLNPNLIYGQGNAGNAGPVQMPSPQAVNFKAPQFTANSVPNVLAIANAQADLKIKAAQADNLKAQNTVIMEDANLRHLQGQTTDFNLGLNRDLRDTSADYRREQLRQLTNNIDQSINENARREVMNSANVDDIMEKIRRSEVERGNMMLERGKIKSETYNNELGSFKLQSERELMDLDGKLRQMDIDLRKQGVMPHDALWQRILAKAVSDFMNR